MFIINFKSFFISLFFIFISVFFSFLVAEGSFITSIKTLQNDEETKKSEIIYEHDEFKKIKSNFKLDGFDIKLYSEFIDVIENFYKAFIDIKKDFKVKKEKTEFSNIETLKVDENLSIVFFNEIKKLSLYLDLIVKNNYFNEKNKFYLFESILDCSYKMYEVLEEIRVKKFNGLFKFLDLEENQKNKVFKSLISEYQKWILYVNEKVVDDSQCFSKHCAYYVLGELKFLFLTLCDCETIEDFDNFLFKFRILIERIGYLFNKRIEKKFSVCFNSVDWNFAAIENLLDKFSLKIKEFLNKNKIDINNAYTTIIESLEKLKNFLEKVEQENIFILPKDKSYSINYTDIFERFRSFDLDYESVFEKLCLINASSYKDYCEHKLNESKISDYLSELVLIFRSLKQKLSKTVCFNDYVRCYRILNEINDRFNINVSENFKNDNEDLEKLSDLVYICKIFADPNKSIDNRLLNILRKLDLKLKEFKETDKNFSFEFLQDIDLLLSLFENIDFTELKYVNSDDFDLKCRCFSILFNENSSIANFLNSLSDNTPIFKLISFFKEPFLMYINEYNFYFSNLDKPESENEIVKYANSTIFRLVRLRIRFFNLLLANRKYKKETDLDGFINFIKQKKEDFKIKKEDSKIEAASKELIKVAAKLVKSLKHFYNIDITKIEDADLLKEVEKKKESLMIISRELIEEMSKLLCTPDLNKMLISYFSTIFEFCKNSIEPVKKL